MFHTWQPRAAWPWVQNTVVKPPIKDTPWVDLPPPPPHNDLILCRCSVWEPLESLWQSPGMAGPFFGGSAKQLNIKTQKSTITRIGSWVCGLSAEDSLCWKKAELKIQWNSQSKDPTDIVLTRSFHVSVTRCGCIIYVPVYWQCWLHGLITE
jgi:hypothetical protein